MMDVKQIAQRVSILKERYGDRDQRNKEVQSVLKGNFDDLAPELFTDEWPRSIVSNRLVVLDMHATAALAPLPNITCSTPKATSDEARKFAAKRTAIANSYIENSRVQYQMQQKASGFYAYGLIVTSVEPDFETKAPQIVVENPTSVYPTWDRIGRTTSIARVFDRNVLELAAEYPEHAQALNYNFGLGNVIAPNKTVSVVKYTDAKQMTMYVEEAPSIVLLNVPNKTGKCTAVATPRPGATDEITGAFDQLIWVQLALHAMQTYTMSGVAQSVNAPIVIPTDVQSVEIGPGSVIRTSQGVNSVGRINLDVPQGAWAAQQYLSQEIEFGAIVPEALGGKIDASVVTGKGVQQLMAGYSQQIALAQESLVAHWKSVLELAFCLDQVYWPDETKNITGRVDNTPYAYKYRPSKDIDGDYSVDVQYGGIAGLDPNRSLVFLLQELGGGIVSKGYVRKHLPSDIDSEEEEARIAVEEMRMSLMQGMSALSQSIPQMVANGQDPSDIIAKGVLVTQGLQEGRPIESVLAEVFPPPEPVQQEPTPEEQVAQAAAAAGGGGAEGFGPTGLPPGLRPDLATRGPGARPDLAQMFAGLTSNGQPNIQAGVSRYIPAQG